MCARGQDMELRQRVLHNVLQRMGFQRNWQHPRLQAGKIQQVIDKLLEPVGFLLIVWIKSRCSSGSQVTSSASSVVVNPLIEVNGVRSSCEIMAKNRVLISLARSASWRDSASISSNLRLYKVIVA